MAEAIALPPQLKQFSGKIIDCDAHEMLPAQTWVETFGEEVRELADLFVNHETSDAIDKNHPNVPNFQGDVAEITSDAPNMKGSRAPGATDLDRRIEVMDAMGIDRQFLFPTSVGLWATLLIMQNKYDPELMEEVKGDRIGKAKRWVEIYNQWMSKIGQRSDRIRPVPPVLGDTVEELVATTKGLVDQGIRAIWLPVGSLPGGKSVAHPDLDPFWKLISDSKCVIMLHIGTEGKFFESDEHKEWSNAPAFQGHRAFAEFRADPWYFSMLHVPVHNFISTMIQGNVFERFPELRVGVAELAAYWVGPMIETLDMWYENTAAIGEHPCRLEHKPSYYFKKHFRVTPFLFEKIDEYIERYGLEDVLCFSSDYPHVEGGKNTMLTLYNRLERLGPEVIEKFFVTNAQFLMPD